jgi:hypothetical protein
MSANARGNGEVGLRHPHFLATHADCLADPVGQSGRALFQRCLFSIHGIFSSSQIATLR